MKARGHLIAVGVAIVVGLAVVAAPLAAHADKLDRARVHYKKGAELFTAGDYEAAVRQFRKAERLAPAPLLDYNIALCHERLGHTAKALKRYRAYLKNDPNSKNHSQVTASIQRLEATLAAARPTESPPPGPAAPPAGPPVPDSEAEPDTAGNDPLTDDEASSVAPEPQPAATYGDAGLNRVAAIDVRRVRDERVASGVMPPPPSAGQPPAGEGPPPFPGGEPVPQRKPFYKKWWVWALVGVGVLTVVVIASSDDNSSSNTVRGTMGAGLLQTQPPDAPVLFRF